MRSTFYGLEIARKGLHAAQVNLEVTAHNIANVNTKGYSRQQVVQKSIEPAPTVGLFDTYNTNNVGGGVDVQKIRQIRDKFIDIQYRKEARDLGEWETKRDILAYIEAVFNEPSDSGINTVLNEFFNSLQALSMNPEDPTTRATVQQKALALTETIRDVYIKLEEAQKEANDGIIAYVEEVNAYAREIAELNEQIYRFEATGKKANDLRDQRNVLLDKLSKIAGISAYEDNNGRFCVYIGGQLLIDHGSAYEIAVVKRSTSVQGTPYPKNNHIDVDDLVEVVWKETGEKVNITGGILKGLIDMRDGIGSKESETPEAPNANTEFGIPYYMKQWNKFAKVLMDKFNEIHREGYALTIDEESGERRSGINFFSVPVDESGNPRQPVAKFIDLSEDIKANWNNIAAGLGDSLDPSNAPPGNNKNVLRLIAMRQDTGDPEVKNLDNFSKALISTLGVSSRQARHMVENQQVLVDEMETRRQSVSGVSLDEEMANMVRFEHAYSAAARVLTAIDQMLDVLINRMGIVGR